MAVKVLLQGGCCFSGRMKTSGRNGIFVATVDANTAYRGHSYAFSYFERTYLHSLISSSRAVAPCFPADIIFTGAERFR